MRRLFTIAALVGISAASVGVATAQGPVRDGLRRTGEIAVDGTQRVVQGTGQVIQGTGQAVRNVGEATLQAAGATARGVRQGVDAVTPDLPLQARVYANLTPAERRHDARWRFARHQGEWWYYSPNNQWMYHRNGDWNEFAADRFQPLPAGGQPMEHRVGYRGADQPEQAGQPEQADAHPQHHAAADHAAPHVRTDRWGRQYICENGRPMYLDHADANVQPADHGLRESTPTERTTNYAPPTPAEAGSAATQAVAPPTPASESQAELQARGVPTDGSAPESPREINNNPNPANGTGTSTGAAKVQTPH
jgi:hypothetical protein